MKGFGALFCAVGVALICLLALIGLLRRDC